MILRFQTVTFLLAVISSSNALQASDIPSDTPVSSLVSSAKSYLASGSPEDALLYFNAAIAKDPTNYVTIFQRGAAYLSLGRHSKATGDFDSVLSLKPGFEGALLQRAKIHTRSGDWSAARSDLQAAGAKGQDELAGFEEAHNAAILAENAGNQGDWEECVTHAGTAILKAGAYPPLRQLRAKCRFERGEVQEGVSDLTAVLQLSPGMIQPHLQVSSMLFYSLGDTKRGIAQIRKCLHYDPDSKICSRLYRREKSILKQLDLLDEYSEKRKFTKVIDVLLGSGEETGLMEDVREDGRLAREDGAIHANAPNALYASLVEKTCASYRAMNNKRKAKPFCSEILDHDSTSLHGLLSKAETHLEADEFEAAIETLNTANEHHPNTPEIRTLHQKAQTLLKRSKQKDYYKVLEVDRESDAATIKQAYRRLTKQYHPDKARAQGASKEEAEKKMASINEAYEVLSDPELKARFDRGDDPNDPTSQGNPFQGNPFGPGSGGQQFFYQHGGGGQHFKFSQGFGGFPFG